VYPEGVPKDWLLASMQRKRRPEHTVLATPSCGQIPDRIFTTSAGRQTTGTQSLELTCASRTQSAQACAPRKTKRILKDQATTLSGYLRPGGSRRCGRGCAGEAHVQVSKMDRGAEHDGKQHSVDHLLLNSMKLPAAFSTKTIAAAIKTGSSPLIDPPSFSAVSGMTELYRTSKGGTAQSSDVFGSATHPRPNGR
jgi:hypothetical protein